MIMPANRMAQNMKQLKVPDACLNARRGGPMSCRTSHPRKKGVCRAVGRRGSACCGCSRAVVFPSLARLGRRLCAAMLLLCGWLDPTAGRAQPAEPLRWLPGHTQGIYAVAATSDGQSIVSAGLDGQVIVWDRASGGIVCRIPASPRSLLALDLSTAATDVAGGATTLGGLSLVAGGLDRTVRMFDVPRVQPLAAMTSFAGQPKAVAVSADGQIVITADSGRLLRQWNPATGAVVRDFGGVAGDVVSVALIGEPPVLLAACADGTLQSWYVESGQPAGNAWTPALSSLAAGPGDRSVTVGGTDGVLRLLAWPPTAARGLAGHAGVVAGVVVSSRGEWAATACADQQVRMFDTASGQQLRSLPGLAGPATALALSTDEQVLAAASAQGRIHCWNPHDGTELGAVRGHDGPVRGLAFRPRQRELISGGADGLVRLWNMPRPVRVLGGHESVPSSAAVSRDGRWGASGGADRIVRLWDLQNGNEAGRLAGHAAAVTCVAISAEGTWLASGDEQGTVRIWERAAQKEVGVLGAHAVAVTCLAFDPSGQRLLSTGADGSVKIWRLPCQPSESLPGHIEPVRGVAASRDGSVLASVSADQTVRIWQRMGEAPARVVAWQGAAATAVDVSSEGSLVVAGNALGQVRIWRVDGTELAELQGGTAAISSVQFDPQATRVAAAGADGSVRIWNLPAMLDRTQQAVRSEPARELTGHEGAVTSVAWSHDGSRLATSGTDRTVRLWDTAADEPPVVYTGAAEAIVAVDLAGQPPRLFAAVANRQIVVWALDAPAAPQVAATLPAAPRCMDLNDDGSRACVGGEDGMARLFDLQHGLELERFSGHQGPVTGVLLAADGRLAVSASEDKTLRIWHPAAELALVAAERATCCAFVDAQHFVAAGPASAVQVRDLQGNVVQQLAGGQGLACLAVDERGTLLAGGGADMNLYVWRLPQGELLAAIPTAAAILAVACNSDGSQVAVAHADQTLRSYTPAGGWLAEQIALPAVPAAAAWAAGHESVLVACADQQLRLVPLALRRLFAAHDSAITGLCCLADADRLATCGEDGSVRLWNSATGEQLAVWRVSGGGPVACVAAEQGQVAAAAGQSVFVWNAADPAAQAVVLDLPTVARTLSFTPGGNYLAAACENGEILRFDMASRQLLERCLGHSGPVHALAHAGERETLLSGGQDGLAYVWKPAGRAAVTVSKQPIVLLALGDDQHVVAASADGALSAWGTEGLAPSWQHAPQNVQGTPPRALAASQAGTVVFATQQRAQLLEAGTGKLLAELELPEPPTAAALGRQQLMMAFPSGVLRSYEVHAQRGGWQIEPAYDLQGLAQPAVALALAEASHALYAAGGEPALRRWFAPSLSPRLVLADRPAPVQAVALNAQGTRLAVAEGAEVGLYDTAEGRALARCAGHDGPVWGLAFQPGGERLASAGRDGQLRLWDPNGNQLAMYTDPSRLPLYSVAWRADGMRLAAAGAARQWFVLEPGAQEPLLRGHGHNDTVYRVAFNPAGNRLATVDFSGGLCIWDANDGRLLFHQQLPATTVWSLAYTPDGRELAVGTQDPRLIVLAIPQ